MDADELARARAMMAAAPAGVQDMIRTLYADESQRGALAAMLGPFGLTLDDLEAVLADE